MFDVFRLDILEFWFYQQVDFIYKSIDCNLLKVSLIAKVVVCQRASSQLSELKVNRLTFSFSLINESILHEQFLILGRA